MKKIGFISAMIGIAIVGLLCLALGDKSRSVGTTMTETNNDNRKIIVVGTEWSDPIVCGDDDKLKFYWAPKNCALYVRDLRYPNQKYWVDHADIVLPRHLTLMQIKVAENQPFERAVVGYAIEHATR